MESVDDIQNLQAEPGAMARIVLNDNEVQLNLISVSYTNTYTISFVVAAIHPNDPNQVFIPPIMGEKVSGYQSSCSFFQLIPSTERVVFSCSANNWRDAEKNEVEYEENPEDFVKSRLFLQEVGCMAIEDISFLISQTEEIIKTLDFSVMAKLPFRGLHSDFNLPRGEVFIKFSRLELAAREGWYSPYGWFEPVDERRIVSFDLPWGINRDHGLRIANSFAYLKQGNLVAYSKLNVPTNTLLQKTNENYNPETGRFNRDVINTLEFRGSEGNNHTITFSQPVFLLAHNSNHALLYSPKTVSISAVHPQHSRSTGKAKGIFTISHWPRSVERPVAYGNSISFAYYAPPPTPSPLEFMGDEEEEDLILED